MLVFLEELFARFHSQTKNTVIYAVNLITFCIVLPLCCNNTNLRLVQEVAFYYLLISRGELLLVLALRATLCILILYVAAAALTQQKIRLKDN